MTNLEKLIKENENQNFIGIYNGGTNDLFEIFREEHLEFAGSSLSFLNKEYIDNNEDVDSNYQDYFLRKIGSTSQMIDEAKIVIDKYSQIWYEGEEFVKIETLIKKLIGETECVQ